MKIHPTAVVDPSADLADSVQIGPYCIVEGDVRIGPGCVLRSHAIVRRYTTMGAGNMVDSFAVLGGEPQDFKFRPETVSYLRIGEGNVFREGVTISRATGEGNATTVGDRTLWMANSHAGHNAAIGDECVFVNDAAIAGHATIGRRVTLSSHVGVHQFTWVGELVMARGHAGISAHTPPFTVVHETNRIAGLNVVGLRRAEGVSDEDRRQIAEAFHLTYRSGLTTPKALERMDACADWGPAAGRFRDFVRRVLSAEGRHHRPLCAMRRTRRA
jgi:UDP-N-acetylglucosamine acyltransferase